MTNDSYDQAMASVYREVHASFQKGDIEYFPKFLSDWFMDKAYKFRDRGFPYPATAMNEEYQLWPNRSTAASKENSRVNQASAPTEADGGASQVLQSVKNAVRSFTGQNVTLREAAFHTYAPSNTPPRWSLGITLEADEDSKESALTRIVVDISRRFPEGSRIKYIQYHRIGSGYWNIDVEVPVK